MTTLVGIEAQLGTKGIVLGSDMARTHVQWMPQGDIFYKQQRRTEGQKIFVNEDGTAAICMTGIFDNIYNDFLIKFIDGRIDFKEKLEKGYFNDLADMTLNRWCGKLPDEKSNSLLIATRFKDQDPKLYTIFPLGAVEQRTYTSIGSGADYALGYIHESGKLTPGKVDIPGAIDLAVSSLDKASQDLYTGGLDLVVVTSQGITDLGKRIRMETDKARLRAIESAKREIR